MNPPASLRHTASLALTGPLLLLLLLLPTAGCRHHPDPAAPGQAAAKGRTNAAETYAVRGVVLEIPADRRSARIKHEAIPGYMAAMTMPFDVHDPHELDGVNPGDQIAFRLNVTATDGWIDRIEVKETGQLPDPKVKVDTLRKVRIVDELNEGDVMPDYKFVNEQRRPTTLGQFRGQALGITFIYTRCPYPTFCPRQSTQFAAACQQLLARPGGPTNWHLLSISFDPAHDTPSVLRNYARTYKYDPQRWNFLTGEMIDIDAITEQFGMFFARDGEGFSHNVRTVVVNAAGRIQKIWVGNQWTAEEFVAEMIRAAPSPSPSP